MWTRALRTGGLFCCLYLQPSQSHIALADDPSSSAAGAVRSASTSSAPRTDDVTVNLERISDAFARISETVKPSVVHITAKSLNKAIFRELQRMQPTTGTGSGIILDAEGHIVTNNHVVEGARRVYVTLADGRKFTAHTIGADANTDIAVLKINADRLVPAKLGDSDGVRVGQLVLAIGSPFRLGHSVSHGIISAMGRGEDGIDVEIPYKNWIQTDAPINTGNSGGPLINVRGEVVGINVAIATESGGHQGVGFAIPSNTVTRISNMLKNGEKIVRGYLGVEIKPVDDRFADAYGLSVSGGAFIDRVVGDYSPAEKAGLKPEDIVLAVDGRQVKNRADLQELIATYKPGTKVALTVWRKGSQADMPVIVGAQPAGFSPNQSSPRTGQYDAGEKTGEPADENLCTGRFADLGFEAEELTASNAKKLKLGAEKPSGILVTKVDPLSDAAESGLNLGAIILKANDRVIRTLDDLQEVLTESALSKGVRLKVRVAEREDGRLTDAYVVLRVR